MLYPTSTQALDPPVECNYDRRQGALAPAGARLGATLSVRRSAIRPRWVRSLEEIRVTRHTLPQAVFLSAEEVIQ
jgi:hypothetical protein